MKSIRILNISNRDNKGVLLFHHNFERVKSLLSFRLMESRRKPWLTLSHSIVDVISFVRLHPAST